MKAELLKKIDELTSMIYSLEQIDINEKFLYIIELLIQYASQDNSRAQGMKLALESMENAYAKKDYVALGDGLFLLKKQLLLKDNMEKDVPAHG